MIKSHTKIILVIASAFFLAQVWAYKITEASHSWGNYHWMRSSNSVTLQVGDNVSSIWDGHLTTAIGDWNASSVVQLVKKMGLTNPKNCKPVAGRIEVCNAKYGRNGWLGIAQIWVSNDHITQAVSKMNDTYFNTSTYNTPAWRQFVICQELAHDFGLDHQDENFYNPNLGSCMDYTNNPSGPPSNEHPNAHDFAQLETIYAHLDAAFSSLSETIKGNRNNDTEIDSSDPTQWGKIIRKDAHGRANLYERDLGKGEKIITHILWADSVNVDDD